MNGIVTLDAFLNEAVGNVADGYITAAFTDSYRLAFWPGDIIDELRKNECKVLEIRIFDEKCEYRLFRSDISKEFVSRVISDDIDRRDSYVEYQLLDVDEKASEKLKGLDGGRMVRTTGGGEYFLPLPKEEGKRPAILIKYYVGKYEKTGQARVEDWRAAGFENVPMFKNPAKKGA